MPRRMAAEQHHPPVRFDTHPDRYRHLALDFPPEYGGAVARLQIDIPEDGGLRPGYPLKLNSYDLGVDIEIADVTNRLRFEHPNVRALIITSAKDRIFCSGANIYMLGMSSHAFKVNFCKFTNETRFALEEMSEASGVHTLAALNGTASGGGYELAIACDEIVLVDDGSSAVSLPEAPLLGVLPGTGGLTRVVDKRKVRRDLADVFSTVAEGVRGKRALEWRLVDEAPAKGQFQSAIKRRVEAMVQRSKRRAFAPVILPALSPTRGDNRVDYKYVTVEVDVAKRTAALTVKAPSSDIPATLQQLIERGAATWPIQAFRELDDALLDLRFNYPLVGTIAVKTSGDAKAVVAMDEMLTTQAENGLVCEVTLLIKRVLKRLDMTARSLFAIVDRGSCFAGSLFELALASDRIYMLDDTEAAEGEAPHIALSPMNDGPLPMANGLTRLQTRFLGDPLAARRAFELRAPIGTQEALAAGLVTFAPDDLDWDDEIRIAFEERASMSPDAMTGMEANLRFAGPETLETKVFGRLTAWQNWIFQRPNAVGGRGALTLYGKPERPEFDFART